jgi:hypothetical protein
MLLDTSQYYNNQLFGYNDPNGTNSIKGYTTSVIDAVDEKNNILNTRFSENFDSIIEGARGRRRSSPPKAKKPKKHRSRAKRHKYNSTCGRYRKQRDQFQDSINQLNRYIPQLQQKKDNCIMINTRLVEKNNSLLDSVQYFYNQLFGYNDPKGNNSVKGYIGSLVGIQMEKNTILNQKLGEPKKENFTVKENFSAIYNKLSSENKIIQNQIQIDTEKNSIHKQKYNDLVRRIGNLNNINTITSVILFVIIIISGTVIWFSNKSLAHKFVMIKVVWLYVILIEILQYVLFYAYIYVRAFLFGEQATYKEYWKFPHLSWLDIAILVLIAFSVFI